MSLRVTSACLGFPRMGDDRQLKKVVEAFWKGSVTENELRSEASRLRQTHWRLQQSKGINWIPSNDFSLYDHVLDHSIMFGVVPERYAKLNSELGTYFAMARGLQTANVDLPACEMKKWFDCNYHFIVPEIRADQQFKLAEEPKAVVDYNEAKSIGVNTRPVIIGPVTYILLSKLVDDESNVQLTETSSQKCHHVTKSLNVPLTMVDKLVPIYVKLLQKLEAAGAEWIQIDEPYLITDLSKEIQQFYTKSYNALAAGLGNNSKIKLMLTSYFGRMNENLDLALSLPVAGIHVDLINDSKALDTVIDNLKNKKIVFSAGLINGRNIWINELRSSLNTLRKLVDTLGSGQVIVSTSCSLLHSPHTLARESTLDTEIKQWLAFATEKLDELHVLTRAINEGNAVVERELTANNQAVLNRRTSSKIHKPLIKEAMSKISPVDMKRQKPFSQRDMKQRELLKLPLFPTTTIGSFPQTAEIRSARARFNAGKMSAEEYDAFLKKEIRNCVEWQESIGLDVLCHGECERVDMVEYFGLLLDGFCFTKFGWVQSYGSRCVKPPIIFGDIDRSKPMTVYWSQYAASLTSKPMKAMLTGPVTILKWSFVRDDQPMKDTCYQLALALRKEVLDLEAAGLKIIQVDEAALRELLSPRKSEWNDQLQWTVDSFRLATSGVKDTTVIETHMCYSDFQDIMQQIARLDADNCTIENSRSDMRLLLAFQNVQYPARLGPGLYDIHSPRVPTVEEMYNRAKELLHYLKPEQLQINPDCGLKTRGWPEVKESLINLVEVARRLRSNYANYQIARA